MCVVHLNCTQIKRRQYTPDWRCIIHTPTQIVRRLFSSVFAITVRSDIGLYGVSLSMSLLGFGMRTMLANFHMFGIMLV